MTWAASELCGQGADFAWKTELLQFYFYLFNLYGIKMALEITVKVPGSSPPWVPPNCWYDKAFVKTPGSADWEFELSSHVMRIFCTLSVTLNATGGKNNQGAYVEAWG